MATDDSFDDTQRLALPIGHDAERTRFRWQPVLRFERPQQTSSRALRSRKHELRELVSAWFIVVEVEGLIEAGKSVTADCGTKLIPEGLDGWGDGHAHGPGNLRSEMAGGSTVKSL